MQRYYISCKNCNYTTQLDEGILMYDAGRIVGFEKTILQAKKKHQDVKEKLKNKKARIDTNAIYLCTRCKELKTSKQFILIENVRESPNKRRFDYDVSFPFGNAICDECNSEMIFLDTVLSDEIKCPKCGSDLEKEKGMHFI